MKIFSLFLMFISIILRFIIVINNYNVQEFNFLGVVIPLDFIIFIFGSIIFLLYTDSRNMENKLKKIISFYERFKNK